MGFKELYEQAKKNKKTVEITPAYFEFKNKGDGFVGRFISRSEVTSKLSSQTYYQYLFETDGGLIKCAFGRATDNEAGGLLKVGEIYAVTYLGTEKITGGRRINRFKIEHVVVEEGESVGGDEDIPF